MIYLFNCINDLDVELRIVPNEKYIEFFLGDSNSEHVIILSKKDVFELVGALHYIQKNLRDERLD